MKRYWHFQFGGIVEAKNEREAKDRAFLCMAAGAKKFLERLEPAGTDDTRHKLEREAPAMLETLRDMLPWVSGEVMSMDTDILLTLTAKARSIIARLDSPSQED